MDDELKQALEAMETRILERVHDTETRLLKAFHAFANTNDLRLKGLPLLNQRIHELESRAMELDARLLEIEAKLPNENK